MPWNLPDDPGPSQKKATGKNENARNLSGGLKGTGGAVERASPFSWLNCFEDGRFHPLRFAAMLLIVLLLASALQGRHW